MDETPPSPAPRAPVAPRVLQSSVNPAQLALTVRGILVLLGPLLIALATALGYDLGESRVAQLTEIIVLSVTVLATVVGSLMVLWGMVRKMLWPQSTSVIKLVAGTERRDV